MRESRRKARSYEGGMVKLIWQDRTGQQRSTQARCIDVSQVGMSVELQQPVEVRQFVKVHADHQGLIGMASVRHCSRRGLQWVAGLELAQGIQWRPAAAPKASGPAPAA